jgi:hypothetical protein
MNKSFIKIEKSLQDYGKGCYWALDVNLAEKVLRKARRASDPYRLAKMFEESQATGSEARGTGSARTSPSSVGNDGVQQHSLNNLPRDISGTLEVTGTSMQVPSSVSFDENPFPNYSAPAGSNVKPFSSLSTVTEHNSPHQVASYHPSPFQTPVPSTIPMFPTPSLPAVILPSPFPDSDPQVSHHVDTPNFPSAQENDSQFMSSQGLNLDNSDVLNNASERFSNLSQSFDAFASVTDAVSSDPGRVCIVPHVKAI